MCFNVSQDVSSRSIHVSVRTPKVLSPLRRPLWCPCRREGRDRGPEAQRRRKGSIPGRFFKVTLRFFQVKLKVGQGFTFVRTRARVCVHVCVCVVLPFGSRRNKIGVVLRLTKPFHGTDGEVPRPTPGLVLPSSTCTLGREGGGTPVVKSNPQPSSSTLFPAGERFGTPRPSLRPLRWVFFVGPSRGSTRWT